MCFQRRRTQMHISAQFSPSSLKPSLIQCVPEGSQAEQCDRTAWEQGRGTAPRDELSSTAETGNWEKRKWLRNQRVFWGPLAKEMILILTNDELMGMTSLSIYSSAFTAHLSSPLCHTNSILDVNSPRLTVKSKTSSRCENKTMGEEVKC